MAYSVAIVDDHGLIAKALASIVNGFDDFEVLYEVENGQALVNRLTTALHLPDIVLLDISMPVMDGFQTAQWLTANKPSILVLALSMQDDDDTLIKMIKCGARGYLHKNVHPAELETAMKVLVSNRFYFPEWATNRVFFNMATPPSHSEPVALSTREVEFLQFAATELTYKAIGEKMFCSARTVESYRDSLFEKLGLKTRIGLVLYAIKHKIVELN